MKILGMILAFVLGAQPVMALAYNAVGTCRAGVGYEKNVPGEYILAEVDAPEDAKTLNGIELKDVGSKKKLVIFSTSGEKPLDIPYTCSWITSD